MPTLRSQQPVESMLRRIEHEFGGHRVIAITSDVLADYRDRRLTEVSSQTVRHELALLRRVLNRARKDWGIAIPSDPFDNLRLPPPSQGRTRRLSPLEHELLLAAARQARGPWVSALIELAIETTMRRSELLALRWEHIDLRARVATLLTSKNRERRSVALSPTAIEVLGGLPRSRTGPVVPQSANAARLAWERCRKRARCLYERRCAANGEEPDPSVLDDLHFHDLRHEGTSRYFEMGLSTMEVASMTGHQDLRMLRRYTHMDAANLATKIAQSAAPTPGECSAGRSASPSATAAG